ncbi:Regulatory protein cys-3, partial [Tolypocladium capitatum]
FTNRDHLVVRRDSPTHARQRLEFTADRRLSWRFTTTWKPPFEPAAARPRRPASSPGIVARRCFEVQIALGVHLHDPVPDGIERSQPVPSSPRRFALLRFPTRFKESDISLWLASLRRHRFIMSTYGGRHGPNVSQYLRDLNTISPQETTPVENFNMEDDLALFTNTQFFDFDSGQNMDFQAHPAKPDVKAAGRHSSSSSDDVASAPSAMGDMPNLDFMAAGDFNFTEFNNSYAAPPSINTFADGAQNFQSLQPNHAAAQVTQQQAQFRQNSVRPAEKRKPEAMSVAGQQINFEDASRHAAEEDKRRRNTAASARFRIKKKQREQALEKSAKEMTDKISSLETRVSQLETENKWLKNLLVEKNEGSEDITTLWKEFTKHAAEKTKASSSETSNAEAAEEDR